MTSDEHRGVIAEGEQSVPLQAGEYPAIAGDLFCTKCGYNLRGLTSNRCPECGYSLEELRSAVPGIPWVHRRHLGWFRAYWKTVWLVMFRQTKFCDEIARDVRFADSQSFRWLTILHVYLPILVGTIVLYSFGPTEPFGDPSLAAAFVAVWPAVVLHILLVVYLAAATGVPSYFFHPRSLPIHLQNRAIALSYYACGPLGAIFLPALVGMIPMIAGLSYRWEALCLLIAFLVPLGQMTAWWLDLIHITRRVMSQRPRRAFVVGMCVPLLWLTLVGLVFIVLPFAVPFVLLVIRTLA